MNNLAPFVRVFTNTLGNGRWFDSFVNDLVPTVARRRDLHRRRHDAGAGCNPTAGGQRMSGTLQRGVALAAALVLLAALGWTILKPAGQYRVTAFFTGTVGLYPGSDVRVLGIPSATITDIPPLGDKVRVEMLIDEDYDIPADADAIVLAPSLVSDRYVQFAPVYDGGPDHGGRRRGAPGPHRRPRWSSTRSTARSTSCRRRSGPTAPTRTARCRTSSTSARPTSRATARRSTGR